MRGLSKVAIAVLVVCALWFVGVLAAGYSDISSQARYYEYSLSDEFTQCARANRTDCWSQRDRKRDQYARNDRGRWLNVILAASIPPILVLGIGWLILRGRRAKSA